MTGVEITTISSAPRVVLYADISGSTRLYEEFGDAAARDATAACVAVMAEVVERFGGRIVKTIGDEIMAEFSDPSNGAMAATDLQGAVRRAGEEGRFVTGPLRIKVGLHHGAVIEEDGDLFGEAPTIARQIIGLAKADQVLTSRATLEALPPLLRMNTRFVDAVSAEGVAGEIEVHEFIWEVSGLTQVADIDLAALRDELTAVHLAYRDQTERCDAERPVVTLGRVEGNDFVVPTDLTSRHHAEIEFKNGRVRLTDNSANGTLVIADDGATTRLRREHTTLKGSGRICLGGTPEKNPEGILTFRCE